MKKNLRLDDTGNSFNINHPFSGSTIELSGSMGAKFSCKGEDRMRVSVRGRMSKKEEITGYYEDKSYCGGINRTANYKGNRQSHNIE
jgi:hypothetical protein